MTKKAKILCAIGGVFVAVALAIALIFIFSGEDNQPQPTAVDLNGTWVVVAEYNDTTPTFADNQFMVFENGTASIFKDNLNTPYASSAYTVDSANQMNLPDISRKYKVDKKTDNCIRLYETTTKYLLLIKNDTSELKKTTVDTSMLEGKWNIVMKGDQFNNGEAINFVGNTIEYFKTSADTPDVTADYTLNDKNVIAADSINLKLGCFRVDNKTMLFVEESGIVWELSKAE